MAGLKKILRKYVGPDLGRYELVRETLRLSGVLDKAWGMLRPGVYIFNYHRVGHPSETAFDPNVFSCDTDRFREHVAFLKRRFKIIGISELCSVLEARKVEQPLALITFDDGYRDNFTEAVPVLAEAEVPGVFFLPTGFIGTAHVPWWDEIAWLVKHTKKEVVELPFSPVQVAIAGRDAGLVIRQILTLFKRSEGDGEVKLQQIRDSLECAMSSTDAAGLFLSWEDARQMKALGMDLGSHTHSHRILSHLSAREQETELRDSKAILEQELQGAVDSIAYPVGAVDSFTNLTQQLAREAGYRVGFSFIRGVNAPEQLLPFELRRFAVEENAAPVDLQYSVAVAAGRNYVQSLPVPEALKRAVQ